MKWTLITILSRNFKFVLNVGGGGGEGWGCYSRKQLSIFQVEVLPENPVSMEGFYKEHKFRPNKFIKPQQISYLFVT